MLLRLNGNDEVSMADMIAQMATMAADMADMKEGLAVRSSTPSLPPSIFSFSLTFSGIYLFLLICS